MGNTISSIDRICSFAVARADLGQSKESPRLGVDFAVMPHAPFQHFVGVDKHLFNKARIDAMGGQSAEGVLNKLDVCGREIFRRTDLNEARVVFWPGPNNCDDFIHGDVLSVLLEQGA